MEIDVKKMAEKLVELRGEKTQAKVAGDLNISVSALSMYEAGERVPRDQVKIRLADYYNEAIENIFFIRKVHET